jgi:TrmH family RNA methyltransferase
MTVLRSRDNPKVKRWMRLATDGRFRRTEGRALIEGPHLVAAAQAAGVKVYALLLTDDALTNEEIRSLTMSATPLVLSTSVFRAIVESDTPQGIAAEIEIPRQTPGKGDSAYLEGVQDAGNVGAIIRSAAAFGIRNIYLGKHCADPWSPKVLRAGAGGHFQLTLIAGKPPEGMRLVCTVAKGGTSLKDADLTGPLCWVFGSEGQGVSPEVQRKAAVRVTIPLEPGTESLNVAAAAAACLYETFSKRAGGS